MTLLDIKNVKKKYRVRKFGSSYGIMAVNGVDFSIKEGTCVGLVGESGCGKSTLTRMIMGLEMPTEGEICYQKESIFSNRKKSGRLKFCQSIQLVFQDSFDAVNPRYTAQKIVEEPLKNLTDLTASERKARVEELLEQVGIAPSDMHKYGMEFSGGQLQRICIARALATNPQLLLLDEPLSSLDVSVQAQMLNLLRDIKEERNLSYLLISHDLEAVYYLADALVVMYGGQVMERIDDIQYFHEMEHPYTKHLLSANPAYRSFQESEEAEAIGIGLEIQKENYEGCAYGNRCPYADEKCRVKRPKMLEIRSGHFVACHNCERGA